jgi:plasmid stability protein
MPAMTLRNLDPEVLETLRARAREEGRSLHSLICEILTRAAREDQRRARMREQRPEAERLRRRLERRGGKGTPSEKLVRADRRR